MTSRLLALVLVLAAVAFRTPLEASMTTHMLVQLPLLFTAGLLWAPARQARRTHPHDAWRLPPVPVFVFATGVMTAWMIPRALDAAVEHAGIDALKAVSLVLAGRLSLPAWRESTHVVRTFVAGNSAWMTATVGVLYLDTPARLCTSYGRAEQQQAGIALVAITVIALTGGGWWLIRRSGQSARSNAGSI